jgi:hypothetical protein
VGELIAIGDETLSMCVSLIAIGTSNDSLLIGVLKLDEAGSVGSWS